MSTVRELLGPAPFEESPLLAEPAVGVATGLAWTVDGGVVQRVKSWSTVEKIEKDDRWTVAELASRSKDLLAEPKS